MKPAAPNRLAQAASPYLLQHALNPVDWYPWGEEALARARAEDKPIFLSIGYSACHWCHVMAHESFEDPAIGTLLRRHFISIKVDREERPDLDTIYMTAVQGLTGRGGWPLSVFLTPDLQPFFGGTYYPPEPRGGLPGFPQLLQRIADLWTQRRASVRQGAEELTRFVRAQAVAESGAAGEGLDATLPGRAAAELERALDPRWGGFGDAPKFPPSGALALLLRRHRRTGNAPLLAAATLTLDRMAAGGLYDQLGGGFHRYAVDEAWQVPHFEKMLYDNALLAGVYLDAWRVTGRASYRRIAAGTLDYLLREMRAPTGGFYASQDADSEGEEGRFYVWTPAEFTRVLGPRDGARAAACFGVTAEGPLDGRSVLHRPQPLEAIARAEGLAPDELDREVEAWRERLLAARAQRPAPGRDEKILASWNALAISALAHGAQTLEDPRYRAAADDAADFLLGRMRPGGGLRHSVRDDRDGPPAFLDDYAFALNALIDLYETTLDTRRLAAADDLAQTLLGSFSDAAGGGFFLTAADQPEVVARTKPYFDGAEPSGNAAAAQGLWRLGRLLDRDAYRQAAERTLQAFVPVMRQAPRGLLCMIGALDDLLQPGPEIVIVGRGETPETRALWRAVNGRLVPGRVLAGGDPAQTPDEPFLVPMLRNRPARDGRATAYVCRTGACAAPVHTPAELAALLTA